MQFLLFLLKILLMAGLTFLMALPFILAYSSFKKDKENKISYKRFRILVFTFVYAIAMTLTLYLLKEFFLWLGSQAFVQQLAQKLALKDRTVYFSKVLIAILVNAAVGFVFILLEKLVKIGLKKKDLTHPGKKDPEKKTGEEQTEEKKEKQFTWRQKAERRVIRFFNTETWFFVARILKYLAPALSALYALVFILYQLPCFFGADWIPYAYITQLFSAGYLYPTITLLCLWQMYFFLEGIRRLEQECEGGLEEDAGELKEHDIDLEAIDAEIRKQFKDYYSCDVDLSERGTEELASTAHHEITEYIGQAVENDRRNPHGVKTIYLDCLDRIVENEDSILINGDFFSEFSMYFLRYLSILMARGDNVIFLCNSEVQLDAVYDYIKQAFSEHSSLYCQGFGTGAVSFDDPIWKIVKISGEGDSIEEVNIDESSILITTLDYVCSAKFETEHSGYFNLLSAVVFVDTINTVNAYPRQMSIFNTRLKQITRTNAVEVKNSRKNPGFKARFMEKQVRYICFDYTRTPGLDLVLKNMLAVKFNSADAMRYHPKTLVRCYQYEARPDENGRRICPQFLRSEEELGAIMNVAVLCLTKGASRVTIFADDGFPYENIAESIDSNRGQLSIKADGSNLILNKVPYDSGGYSVILAMDTRKNLPAALRHYMSMVSDKPALVIVFSQPYMLRDYYTGNIRELWESSQIGRIPVLENTKHDALQKILLKANSGGITEEEILSVVADIPGFEGYVRSRNINGILRQILREFGVTKTDSISVFNYFEYTTTRDFNEAGRYVVEDRVVLRRYGEVYEFINGRDMVVLSTEGGDIRLSVPRSRLTQNFIPGQNLLHNGSVYQIRNIRTDKGVVLARLAVDGRNTGAYQYIQSREYRVEAGPEQIEHTFPTKHLILKQSAEDVSVSEVFLSVFYAPTEVITRGYYEIDPHTLAINAAKDGYHDLSGPENEATVKQIYRKYGQVTAPLYSSDSMMKAENRAANDRGALMMSIRLVGQFGADVNRTMMLAAVMLNEILHSMFPSVADSVAVCPVLHSAFTDADYETVLQKQSTVTILGGNEMFPPTDFELVIIEDNRTELGVVSALMAAGDNVLTTLFTPIYKYLKWYAEAEEKSDYLYYGLDHEPACFDFEALSKLSRILGDDRHDVKFVDAETLVEYEVCDFCGKRYPKGDQVVELEDGRLMCAECAKNLVGNNKRELKAHLDRARIFLESTYGITLDDDYEFCFESTVKIVNTLKKSSGLVRRGNDVPLRSYVDDKKKVHVEYSIPSASLSELLVRELTHVWQLKHVPDLEEELAEGHLALVAVQYLRFLNQSALVRVRTGYYESTANISGVGYRRLVRELLANPQYSNNPFRYLLELTGGVEDEILPPTPKVIEPSDFGLPYTPEKPDRCLDGNISYFYYPRLTATCQRAYDTILTAIQNHQETVTVDGCDFEDVVKVVDSIRFDRPELFYFSNFSMRGQEVTLLYGASAEETAVLQRRIDEVVPRYLEGIDDSMSAYDVALRLHVKVINSVDYDTIALNREKENGGPDRDKIDYLRTICGVFLEGKAVCEGYARAMQYLLQKCGVECAECAGYIHKENGENGGGHAWNILRVDGDHYYLDTTWDDSSNTIQSVKNTNLGFGYFCITTQELTRTRDLKMCPTDVPVCTATRGNYYHHNDLVLGKYDPAKIKVIAQAAAKNKSKFFTFKCASKAVFDETLSKLCASGQDCYEALKAAAREDKQIISTSYSYSYDPNIWTITIMFKFK